MKIDETIIGKLFINTDDLEIDVCRPEPGEYTAGKKVIEKLFEEENISDEHLRNSISEAMNSYAAYKAPYSFKKGFLLAMELMIEFYSAKVRL